MSYTNKISKNSESIYSILGGVFTIIVFLGVIFSFIVVSIDAPIVYLNIDGGCVKVDDVTDNKYTCDNLPVKYQVIYVGE